MKDSGVVPRSENPFEPSKAGVMFEVVFAGLERTHGGFPDSSSSLEEGRKMGPKRKRNL